MGMDSQRFRLKSTCALKGTDVDACLGEGSTGYYSDSFQKCQLSSTLGTALPQFGASCVRALTPDDYTFHGRFPVTHVSVFSVYTTGGLRQSDCSWPSCLAMSAELLNGIINAPSLPSNVKKRAGIVRPWLFDWHSLYHDNAQLPVFMLAILE